MTTVWSGLAEARRVSATVTFVIAILIAKVGSVAGAYVPIEMQAMQMASAFRIRFREPGMNGPPDGIANDSAPRFRARVNLDGREPAIREARESGVS